MMGSRLISNPVDVEKILMNVFEELKIKYLERSFKLI